MERKIGMGNDLTCKPNKMTLRAVMNVTAGKADNHFDNDFGSA